MTIRMLQAWNGLHQQKIVTTLSGSDEAALVAAGIATYDLDGPSENLRMAQLATDAGGGIKSVFSQSRGAPALRAANVENQRVDGVLRTFVAPPVAAAQAITYMVNQPVFGTPSAFQIVYHNWTGAAITPVNGALAATPNHTNDGTGLTWTQDPALPSSIPAGITDADPVNMVPGIALGGRMTVPTVARDDGGTLRLMQIRAHLPANINVPQISSTIMGYIRADTSLGGFQDIEGNVSSTNRTSPISALVPSHGLIYLPYSLRCYYDKPTVTVATVGDSRLQGYAPATASGYQSPAMLAAIKANARQSDVVVVPMCYARGSQKHSFSYQTAVKVLNAYRPNFLLAHAWSPNDTPTQAAMDQAWYDEFLPLLDLCQRSGTTLIAYTSGAQNALDATQNALRLAQNSRVRSLCSSFGIPMIDEAAIVDSADTRSINSAYNSGDNLHYNAAFYDLTSDMISSIVAMV